MIESGIPVIFPSQYLFLLIMLQLVFRQTLNPVRPLIHGRARPIASVFSIIGSLMGNLFSLVVPTLFTDMSIHETVDEHRFCILPPWPSQISALRRTIAGKTAVVHYVAIKLSRGSGSGSDVTVNWFSYVFGEQFAFLKIGGSSAEDKINISFNITILITVAAH